MKTISYESYDRLSRRIRNIFVCFFFLTDSTTYVPLYTVRAERILSMGGFEIFFYLREDWNQFFQVLLLFSIRKLVLSQNLRED